MIILYLGRLARCFTADWDDNEIEENEGGKKKEEESESLPIWSGGGLLNHPKLPCCLEKITHFDYDPVKTDSEKKA